MSPGLVVLVVAVLGALAFGGYRALTDGRFRGTRAVRADTAPADGPATAAGSSADGVLAGTPWAGGLGERWTLVQFSSAFCAPCRVTRRILEDVAGDEPGVTHIEIDAEQHLDLVRRLGVLRTPTTLVLDAAGHEVGRAAGAPSKAQVLAVLR